MKNQSVTRIFICYSQNPETMHAFLPVCAVAIALLAVSLGPTVDAVQPTLTNTCLDIIVEDTANVYAYQYGQATTQAASQAVDAEVQAYLTNTLQIPDHLMNRLVARVHLRAQALVLEDRRAAAAAAPAAPRKRRAVTKSPKKRPQPIKKKSIDEFPKCRATKPKK